MRSTGTLKVKGNGENLLEILVAWGWPNTKIFSKHYDKRIVEKLASDFIICKGGFIAFIKN